MVNVAVAGGTGGVGQTIVEVLGSSHHQAFVLSRKPSKETQTVTVDYSDICSLITVLEMHKIHTVISAFSVEGDSLAKSQKNLIEAAIRSKETKRFVPSGYAIPYPRTALQVLPQLKDYFAAIETLEASNLEWTVFHNGIFLDYFGGPSMKSYLKPNVFVIDIANRIAAIPGTGNVPVAFTYTFDLARFVVAALDLEKWEEESRVVGDAVTWHEFVKLAEETTGSKFETHYDSIEKLKQFEITELPNHVALYDHFPKKAFQWFMSIFELFTANGSSQICQAGSLNERFPEIKPLTVKGMLERYWKA
ncbi:Putative NmrA-like family protein [Aspergillus calidoustus]|uniref:Putative NmrA-like family protein n=1 Tax=Aspergillus calidoustus TaxID=454130 RepID=A0A0U5FTB1_ASPCI|nr:Putative NmrA-like family protein [Aspergillus calidoustus]